MHIQMIHNSNEVYEFLKRKNRFNYIYQLNDLAPEVWSQVICYGLYDQEELQQIAMLIMDMAIPVLLAASFENQTANCELIKGIKPFLPPRFYTHIDQRTLETVFTEAEISEVESYMNMGLTTPVTLSDSELVVTEQDHSDRLSGPQRLNIADLPAIKGLLAKSYPDAWLDDELVKLGRNFGLTVNGQLVSFAGIHAYSEIYQVAAVAHVTTHPAYRQRGYSKLVLTALLNDLRERIEYIGLNVKVENEPAINCYRKLGFREFGHFVACVIENHV